MSDAQQSPRFSLSVGGGSTPMRTNVVALVAVVLVAVVVVGIVLFFTTGNSKSHTLTGTVALVAPGNIAGDASDCKGTNEFAEFGPGMVVTVSDGNGDVVGRGETTNKSSGGEAAGQEAQTRCVVTFQVPVDDVGEYHIEVGSLASQTFNRADLEADDWHIGLNLG